MMAHDHGVHLDLALDQHGLRILSGPPRAPAADHRIRDGGRKEEVDGHKPR
jgi:hypothetical protein